MKDANTLLLIIIISSILSLLVYFYFKSKRLKRIRNRGNYKITHWMEMTKDQRRNIDSREKEMTMKRKKSLLTSIRKEYKNIKKDKSI